MLNYIWMGMLLIGFIIGGLNGRLETVTQAAFNSSKSAVELSIGLLGILCLWTGLMGVAEKSGLLNKLAYLVSPLIRVLFPQIPKKSPAIGAIVMNMAANFFGLGNAATPLGLKAMKELQNHNNVKDTASDSMIMFLILNASAIQLVPATIIALRSSAGSTNPAEVIVPIWVASACAAATGIIAVKILGRVTKNQKRRIKSKN
ncbi:nucleoside recognition domain-containing protein [Pseudobacteroides cellulosolvens]|uniref:Nucleoside recognition domain protein n=1 Tax=Pseudobacteroides cellulosolvens ATCC 35603 = DSM 2933 TaxID=398512 RepID=A0A0L6JN07_9FIRM|nr:nucleoside recognition domain-containing protein [Pseudobacteroides cellulosolvens]KNY27154.1 nucleoside recognition domain protein [Pseudobacteroides cellulosolvens ATCC 35603 = DSM 2933]